MLLHIYASTDEDQIYGDFGDNYLDVVYIVASAEQILFPFPFLYKN